MMDELGWIYFCDRLGETYRWRGENVSTVEVENTISEKLKSIEVIVYGVEIAGQEGRAGMATIVDSSVDVKKLYDDIKLDLTSYARPVFIRLVKEVEHTGRELLFFIVIFFFVNNIHLKIGTFKAKKNILMDEGYNVNIIKEKLFYFDTKQQTYLLLTKQVFDDIQNQKLKL
jgi:solute carrier family 27 fatty acid transporter 1/4